MAYHKRNTSEWLIDRLKERRRITSRTSSRSAVSTRAPTSSNINRRGPATAAAGVRTAGDRRVDLRLGSGRTSVGRIAASRHARARDPIVILPLSYRPVNDSYMTNVLSKPGKGVIYLNMT
jgi:hypothetical protein